MFWNLVLGAVLCAGQAPASDTAAHARLGHKDETTRWTRASLAQGLRDIKKFNTSHFRTLLEDPQYRQLVLAVDNPKNLSRDEGFRLDLRFMVHEGKRIHYAPFRSTPEAEIDALASALEADIPKLSEDEIFVRFMGVIRRFVVRRSLIFGRHCWTSQRCGSGYAASTAGQASGATPEQPTLRRSPPKQRAASRDGFANARGFDERSGKSSRQNSFLSPTWPRPLPWF